MQGSSGVWGITGSHGRTYPEQEIKDMLLEKGWLVLSVKFDFYNTPAYKIEYTKLCDEIFKPITETVYGMENWYKALPINHDSLRIHKLKQIKDATE